MTPLEKYQQEKRSGQYHPETEKNWPTEEFKQKAKEVMEDSKVLDEEKDRPTFKPQIEYVPDPLVQRLESLEKKVKSSENGLLYTWIFLAILVAALFYLLPGQSEVSDSAAVTEPRTKVVKKLVKVPQIKRVFVSKNDDTWRKKLCYDYGDWNACLAYKKNLPFRARVGRADL